MKKEEFDNLTNQMQEKLGAENSALISDDLGTLITDYNKMLEDITKRDEQIEKLQKDKENLISVNGNLLQQVSMGKENSQKTVEEEKPNAPFDFRTVFDEKGNFKK